MKKILIVSNSSGRWIKEDAQFLQENYIVQLHQSDSIGISNLLQVFRQDIIFLWFLSLKNFPIFILAKLFGKKIIVNIGGFEIENIQEINYGGFRPGWKKIIREWMIKNSSKVITVSSYLSNHIKQRTGVQNHIIYLGFDEPYLKLKDTSQRNIDFVMVSNIDNETFKIKGFDRFLNMATTMPDKSFCLLGAFNTDLQESLPQNITLKGYMSCDEPSFWNILNDSKFIVQPSRAEAFGSGVMEGAIQGAIPIVSSDGALPEIFKNQGIIVSFTDGKPFTIPKISDGLNHVISKELKEQYSKEKRAISLREVMKF